MVRRRAQFRPLSRQAFLGWLSMRLQRLLRLPSNWTSRVVAFVVLTLLPNFTLDSLAQEAQPGSTSSITASPSVATQSPTPSPSQSPPTLTLDDEALIAGKEHCRSKVAGIWEEATRLENPIGEIVHWQLVSGRFVCLDDFDSAESKDRPPRGLILLEGKLHKPDWHLLIGKTLIKVPADGKFSQSLPIEGQDTVVKVRAVSKFGKVTRGEFKVKVPRPSAGNTLPSPGTSFFKRLSYSIGFGSTSLMLKAGGLDTFATTSLLLKGGVNYLIWDKGLVAGINSFIYLLPLNSTEPKASSGEKVVARFFGINGRVGYQFGLLNDEWQIGVSTGVYYITLFSNGPIRLSNIMGPQLYPSLTKRFGMSDRVQLYLKYSPVSSGLGFLNPSLNREVAFGLSWARLLAGHHGISVSMDYSHLRVVLRSEISSETFSFGINYSY